MVLIISHMGHKFALWQHGEENPTVPGEWSFNLSQSHISLKPLEAFGITYIQPYHFKMWQVRPRVPSVITERVQAEQKASFTSVEIIPGEEIKSPKHSVNRGHFGRICSCLPARSDSCGKSQH